MSDPTAATPGTAGGMLRQARQAQGLHIAALAASIKVAQRKLELLESDQFDQLPDATFTRALAQTVCRALKIDAAPVLALMPPPGGYRLEHVGEGINAPFRDRPDHLVTRDWGLLASPVVWIAALLVIGAAFLYLMPAHWLSERMSFARPSGSVVSDSSPAAPAEAGSAAAAAPADAAASGAAASEARTSPAASASQPNAVEAAAPTSAGPALFPPETAPAEPTGVLELRPSAQSWVEVTDARGQVLISRTIDSGEVVGLDGTPPFKLKIGNAGGTDVTYRGQPVNLAPYTRDNVARMELK